MVGLLCVLALLAVLILQYFIARQFEEVAAEKGYYDSKYFHFCFWLSFVGYLLVIALPDRKNNHQPDIQTSGSTGSDHSQTTQTTSAAKAKPIYPPVDESIAFISGEANIQCANCHRIQFRGNKFCTQCGAKFTKITKLEQQ